MSNYLVITDKFNIYEFGLPKNLPREKMNIKPFAKIEMYPMAISELRKLILQHYDYFNDEFDVTVFNLNDNSNIFEMIEKYFKKDMIKFLKQNGCSPIIYDSQKEIDQWREEIINKIFVTDPYELTKLIEDDRDIDEYTFILAYMSDDWCDKKGRRHDLICLARLKLSFDYTGLE